MLSFITNITPLPPSITREIALALLHDHSAMIELNPLVLRHEPTTAPPNATPEEEVKCKWILITDTISYLPGAKSELSYKAGFYNLPYGIQTHCFAPGGVNLKAIWRVGGNQAGETPEAPELGIAKPSSGLYLREDVEVRCNVFISGFVKKNLKKAHGTLVEKLLSRHRDSPENAQILQDPASPVDSIGSIPSFRPMTPPSPHSDDAVSAPPPLSRELTQFTLQQPAQQPIHQPVHEEPCSCGPGGHEVMCANYRYGAPPPRRASPAPFGHTRTPSQPSTGGRWPPQGDGTPTGSIDSFSPVGSYPASRCGCRDDDHLRSCQSYTAPRSRKPGVVPPIQRAKDSSYGRVAWKLPPGSSPSVAFRSPQLFGEQAELPGDTISSERDEDWADDDTLISELDSTELVAYWKTAGLKQAPGDAGWI
ncbi:hypothetical protein LTR27_005010 [Elasticomyces elasticus]|nr:hypothetical protein LTR27_005010 [Elasticomyces elasticus]